MHSHQPTQSISSTHSHTSQGAWISQQDVLRPCASTSSLFLFAQGSDIVILRHDTLELHRRFDGHHANITLIAADTCSEEGQGQIISLDEDKEAVVWDSMTGEEIARFTAYEEIRVATFMRNGTIALGDAMGNIILFDPQQSEAVSCRTFQIPITTIAPSADSKFFGIGYENGAMIIASLMPLFVIHHTLTNGADGAFSVTQIAWHGSSSRQKSDMLATQTEDGDLKVWSISKPIDGGEPARIVRMLKKSDGYAQSRNWMSWSRNGRIIQYSDSETAIWDVRTKRVVWEPVPTSDNIIAIAAYGPSGMLFTILKDYTVQQHALYPPALVKSELHKPPNSLEQVYDERDASQDIHHTPQSNGERTYSTATGLLVNQEFQNGHPDQKLVDLARTRTPLGQIAHKLEQLENQGREHASTAHMERTPSTNSNASNHSRNVSIATVSSVQSYDSVGGNSELSTASTQSYNKMPMSPESVATPRRFHPLSQEIADSPITPKAPAYQFPAPTESKGVFRSPHTGQLSPPVDYNSPDFYEHQSYFVPQPAQLELFPTLRSTLGSIAHPITSNLDRSKYDDELRKEMFLAVFGWTGGPESLVREEISTLPPKSLQCLILRLWISDLDQNSLSVLMGSEMLVSCDWMFVALSAMTGAKGWQQAMRVFIMGLIKKNDLHTAVMCLLALGEKENAVDLYVSNKKYMEAVILQALLFKDWRRLSTIVRKWGDHAAENGEGNLAMRCFSCTETPSSTPPLPPASGHQSRPSFGHSRERSLSGSFRTMSPKIVKPPSIKSRAASPAIKDTVMQSLTVGAARLFGFGSDKNKNNETPEADIMEMPWNRPPEANLPTSPTVQSFFEAPVPSSKKLSDPSVPKEMTISSPMNIVSMEARMGTPGLSRIGSPASSLNRGTTPAAPDRTTSPRPPGIARTITPRPGPISIPSRDDVPAVVRTTSPAPVETAQVGEQAVQPAASIPLSSPLQIQPRRVASPPPKAESPPPMQRPPVKGKKPVGLQLQLASFQDVLASEPSPELARVMMPPMHNRQLSGSKLAEEPITRAVPISDTEGPYQTSSESEYVEQATEAGYKDGHGDVHMGNRHGQNKYDENTLDENSNKKELPRSRAKNLADSDRYHETPRMQSERQPERTFSPVHHNGSSNNSRRRRQMSASEEITSEEEEEAQRYEQQRRGRDRVGNHTPKTVRSPSMASGQVKKMGKIIDESEPDDFDKGEYSDEEEAYAEAINREIRARQRSLERMEREMGTLRRERAKEIPRHNSRNANKRSPAQAHRSTFTRHKEYSSVTDDEESSDLDRYSGQDYSRSEEERFEPPRRTASRNAAQTITRTASRNTHKYREEDVPKRINSRMSNKIPRPRDDDITDDEPTPRPPPSPPRRTASRATPRPRTNFEDEESSRGPRRTASRTNNRTPKLRQMEPESDGEETYLPRRTPSRNQHQQYQQETDSDEMRSRRETAANPMPRSISRNAMKNGESENSEGSNLNYRERLANGPSPAPTLGGLPANPSTWRLDRAASPMSHMGTPLMRNPSRSGTPASGLGIHQRKASLSEADKTFAPPTLPFANGPGRASPVAKVASPALSDVPDYDVHSYDLPALAAAAAIHREASSPPPAPLPAPGPAPKTDRKPKMAPSSILNVNHKSSLPQELRTRLNALPPVPDSPMGVPTDLPIHPAFAGNMRATSGLRRKQTPNPHQGSETQDFSTDRPRRGSEASTISGGKQALRMHGGPGPGEQITIGLEGVVMNDGGAPVETAPPPRHGRMTPLGQKI